MNYGELSLCRVSSTSSEIVALLSVAIRGYIVDFVPSPSTHSCLHAHSNRPAHECQAAHPEAFLMVYRYVGGQIAYEILWYSTLTLKQIR